MFTFTSLHFYIHLFSLHFFPRADRSLSLWFRHTPSPALTVVSNPSLPMAAASPPCASHMDLTSKHAVQDVWSILPYGLSLLGWNRNAQRSCVPSSWPFFHGSTTVSVLISQRRRPIRHCLTAMYPEICSLLFYHYHPKEDDRNFDHFSWE